MRVRSIAIATILTGMLGISHALAHSAYDGSVMYSSRIPVTCKKNCTVAYYYDRGYDYRTRYSNDNGCWADPPDCGSWNRVCTSQGWRCDPPDGRYDNYYNDGYNYNDNYDYNYNDNYRHMNDGYRYEYDRNRLDCSPRVACGMPGFTCPSGTYCARYRRDYACIPVDCPYQR